MKLQLASLAALLAWSACAQAEERGIRMDHGLQLTLPAGWRLDEAGEDATDATGRRRVHIICETPECKRTQETCTFALRDKPIPGTDDATRIAGLYEAPLARYFRLRAVLKSTSKDAEILQDLAVQRIGQRDWWVVETDARHNFKSGYFAETVIDGRRLAVTCKTCETGADRHRTARAMLETVSPPRMAAVAD